jgi:hypothetical protein
MPTLIATLRWLAILPAAILAAWLAYFLMTLAWNISLSLQGIDLTSFFVRTCNLAASSLAMGVAFVYVGAYVAPSYKHPTAIGLAIIAVLLMGAMIALALYVGNPDYWALWQGICLAVGAGTAGFAIATEGLRNPLA